MVGGAIFAVLGLAVLGVVACLGALSALVVLALLESPLRSLVLVVLVGLAFAIELGCRLLADRPLHLRPPAGDRCPKLGAKLRPQESPHTDLLP